MSRTGLVPLPHLTPPTQRNKLAPPIVAIEISLNRGKKVSNFSINIDARPGEAKETLAHISRINGTLGWEPTIKVEDWISEQLTPEIIPENENPIRRTFNKFTNWLYGG